MNSDLINISANLNNFLSFEQYNLFFARETYRYWGNLWNLINYTKSYYHGIEVALIFLEKFEQYRSKYNEKEQGIQLSLISSSFLGMLDKADLWEEYLKNWELIKQKSIEFNIGFEYQEYSRKFHFDRGAEEFFLGNTKIGFRLSFMYSGSYRKAVVERKQSKARKSKSYRNLTHEQQSDLTAEEIKERYDWLMNFFKTGEYDFSPPASRQKEKRRKSKESNIVIK